MRSKNELLALADRYGWQIKPLTYAEVRAMGSAEYEFHAMLNEKALQAALDAHNSEGIVEKAESLAKWREIGELHRLQQGPGGVIEWPDSDTAEQFHESCLAFFRSHPELDVESADNGTILGQYMIQNHLAPDRQENFEKAYRALGGRAAFRLSAEAQQRLDEQKLSADEYAKLKGIGGRFDDSRFYNPLTQRVETRTRQNPQILAQKQQVVDTFLESDEAIDYRPTDNNKHNMVEMLRAHNLDWTVQSLKWCWSVLKSKGIAELASTEEQAARKSSGQAVVLHNLGGRAPGYPLYFGEHTKPSFRRLLAEMSSDELKRRCQVDRQFREAVDGLND